MHLRVVTVRLLRELQNRRFYKGLHNDTTIYDRTYGIILGHFGMRNRCGCQAQNIK